MEALKGEDNELAIQHGSCGTRIMLALKGENDELAIQQGSCETPIIWCFGANQS